MGAGGACVGRTRRLEFRNYIESHSHGHSGTKRCPRAHRPRHPDGRLVPALHAWELPEADCPPVRVKLLGELLIAFRDSRNRLGLIDEFCAHRGVSLWFGRNEECGLRCPYHGWKYDVTGQCVDLPSEAMTAR